MEDLKTIPFTKKVMMIKNEELEETDRMTIITALYWSLKRINAYDSSPLDSLMNADLIYLEYMNIEYAEELDETFLFDEKASVQDLFDFFFYYLYTEEEMDKFATFSELCIISEMREFLLLEIENIKKRLLNCDSKEKERLERALEIFEKYKDYDYEHATLYALSCVDIPQMYLRKVMDFVNEEKEIVKFKIEEFKRKISSGEYPVDYNSEAINSFLGVPKRCADIIDFKEAREKFRKKTM